jgi:hypothetical protein
LSGVAPALKWRKRDNVLYRTDTGDCLTNAKRFYAELARHSPSMPSEADGNGFLIGGDDNEPHPAESGHSRRLRARVAG